MIKVILVPTATIGYYRSHRTQLIEVTLGTGRNAQHATVHPSLFYAIFPQLDRTIFGNTAEATPDQLAAIGLETTCKPHHFREVTVEPAAPAELPLQARYVIDPATGRYIVRLLEPRQEISVSVALLRRVTDISPRAVLGAVPLTYAQAAALGFVVTEGGAVSDSVQSDLLPA
ncbi:MAG: hypothetical protein E7E23_02290 [Paenibacillus sp.]|uniref:hypothetical protein n=1 Tax=Paenibacillus sp. TaxID=58172 RepID=UPI0028FE082B|nr:hypothetical protein [Paenibacillus sp.]MDU2239380.1 hypothetical protein [Paenibacillus sp.]